MAGGFLPTDYSGTTPGSASANMPTFIFPLLKNAEIIDCLQELHVTELAKQELEEPHRHKEKVRKALWSLLEICHGTTEEDIAQKVQSSADGTIDELHTDGLVDALFFREVQQLMKTCGWSDFSWRDVYHPTAKRLRIMLSAIMNMARFREDQLRKYMELNEPREQLVAALNQATNEHEQLQADLAEMQKKASSDAAVRDRLAEECQRLETEIARNNKLQSSQREQAETLKKQNTALQDEIAASEWALQEAQIEKENLQAKLVSSPARRQEELSSKRVLLEERKAANQALQEALQECKARSALVEQLVTTVEDTMQIQVQVQDEAMKYEQAIGQVHSTMKEIEDHKTNIAAVVEACEDAERKTLRMEEKVAQERKQSKMRLQALHDALESAKQDLMAVEKERREGMAEIELREARICELERDVQEYAQHAAKEIEYLQNEYQEVEQAFIERDRQRMDAIGQ